MLKIYFESIEIKISDQAAESHKLVSELNVFSIHFILLLVAPVANHLVRLPSVVLPRPLDRILDVLVLSHLLFSLFPLNFFLGLDLLTDLVGSQALELWALLLLTLGLRGLEGVLGEGGLEVGMVQFAHQGLKLLVVDLLGLVLDFRRQDLLELALSLVEGHFLHLFSNLFSFFSYLLAFSFFL